MASRGLKLVGVGVVAVLAVAGGVTVWQWNAIQAHLTANKLRSPTTPEERTVIAEQLLASGETGIAKLVDIFRTGNADECNAVADAIVNHLRDTTPDDPKCVAV